MADWSGASAVAQDTATGEVQHSLRKRGGGSGTRPRGSRISGDRPRTKWRISNKRVTAAPEHLNNNIMTAFTSLEIQDRHQHDPHVTEVRSLMHFMPHRSTDPVPMPVPHTRSAILHPSRSSARAIIRDRTIRSLAVECNTYPAPPCRRPTHPAIHSTRCTAGDASILHTPP